MANLPKRIALVYDRVNRWGGAERTLLALHDLFPQAPLYTSVYDSNKAPWAKVFPQVIPSFLNLIPFAKNHHELIPFLTPISFETFDFKEYDAVISVTSADVKGIVTQPGTFHLCYCLTPTRYLWSHHSQYYQGIPSLLKPLSQPWFSYLKNWDLISSHRPDVYVAISRTVKDRISKYYGFSSQVVYPPVDTDYFSKTTGTAVSGLPARYYLFIGRLVSYKNPDLLISAFNKLNLPLVIVGEGSINWGNPLLSFKTKIQARKNIIQFDWVNDAQLNYLFHNCTALIFFHEEDFGIVPVEAMAAGKPVIALKRGGAAETVIDGLTGVLVESETENALISAVKNFKPDNYDPAFIRNHAVKYSKERFKKEFVKVFNIEWKKYKNTYIF